jgi:hypothetical protein
VSRGRDLFGKPAIVEYAFLFSLFSSLRIYLWSSVMGKRSSFERRPADFYPTPRAAVCCCGGLALPRSSRMAMAYMRALAGTSAATRARMNFLDLGTGVQSVIVQPPPFSHALSCSLSATDETKYRSHPRLSALWKECLTTLSHTAEKLFFFARRVTLGSSIIRLIGTIVRCGLVVDRRPRWGVGKTRSGV